MNFINSSSKNIYIFLGVFLAAFSITVIVCSISMKIFLVKKLRKLTSEYYDYDINDNSYDDYFEAKYRSTIEYIDNIIYIKNRVEKMNKEQHVINQNIYGPVRKTTYFIVIQVHDNLAFLKLLISSLRKVMGISNSVLIFCHDNYDKSLNMIVQTVNFAKYVQIFYPYSNQMFPKNFPGNDLKCCSGDFNCTDCCTTTANCDRNYILVQQKHFWWWHVNFVFDHLKITKNYNSEIVFLEENQYVLNDFLFMLKVLGTLMPDNCPQCEILSFGSHTPTLSQYHVSIGNIIIEPWNTAQPNIGFAFNRTFWNSLKKYRKHFCNFDDYRWDVSLNYLASQRPQGPLIMLSSDAPRVLKINMCDGTVAHCTLNKSIEDVKRFAKLVFPGLYPRNLIFSTDNKTVEVAIQAGEWKDVRDIALCMYFSENG